MDMSCIGPFTMHSPKKNVAVIQTKKMQKIYGVSSPRLVLSAMVSDLVDFGREEMPAHKIRDIL